MSSWGSITDLSKIILRMQKASFRGIFKALWKKRKKGDSQNLAPHKKCQCITAPLRGNIDSLVRRDQTPCAWNFKKHHRQSCRKSSDFQRRTYARLQILRVRSCRGQCSTRGLALPLWSLSQCPWIFRKLKPRKIKTACPVGMRMSTGTLNCCRISATNRFGAGTFH